MIEHDALKECLGYDPDTGIFTRKNSPRCPLGTVAGSRNDEGYLVVTLRKRHFKAHRLAWFYVHGEWPAGQVDHINGVRHDNRIANLRVVTHQQNQANRHIMKPGRSSQFRGVHKFGNKWRAHIRLNQKTRHLGTFAREEDAAAAYLVAAREAFGEHLCSSETNEKTNV